MSPPQLLRQVPLGGGSELGRPRQQPPGVERTRRDQVVEVEVDAALQRRGRNPPPLIVASVPAGGTPSVEDVRIARGDLDVLERGAQDDLDRLTADDGEG